MGSSAATRSAVLLPERSTLRPSRSESEANDADGRGRGRVPASGSPRIGSRSARQARARGDSFDARVDVVSFDAFGLVVFAGRRHARPSVRGERARRRPPRRTRSTAATTRSGRFSRGALARAGQRSRPAVPRRRLRRRRVGRRCVGRRRLAKVLERVATESWCRLREGGVPIARDVARGVRQRGGDNDAAAGGPENRLRSSTTVPRIDVGVPRIDERRPADRRRRARRSSTSARVSRSDAPQSIGPPPSSLEAACASSYGRFARRAFGASFGAACSHCEKRVRRQARFRILQRVGDARAKRQQLRRRMPGVGRGAKSATVNVATSVRPAVRPPRRTPRHPGSPPIARVWRIARRARGDAPPPFPSRVPRARARRVPPASPPLSPSRRRPDVAPERRRARLFQPPLAPPLSILEAAASGSRQEGLCRVPRR